MYGSKPFYKKSPFWVGVSIVVPLLLFLISFRQEVGAIIRLLYFHSWEVFFEPDTMEAMVVLLYNLIFCFGLVFLFWLILISAQAILPIINVDEVFRTAFHLVVYLLGWHGAAVFIKDGKIIGTPEELRRSGPGVVVVDFNSAVVLEEQVPSPGLNTAFLNIFMDFFSWLGLSDRYQSPRICNKGITFIRPLERIRAVVDLRNQFRMQSNNRAYTRDGIEIITNVFCGFTIGQDADVLQVTYAGEKVADNLRVVTFEHLEDGRLKVKELSDELDLQDREEIHRNTWLQIRRNQMFDYFDPPKIEPFPKFDPDRIFAAVSSQARDDKKELVPWDELPALVAVDVYRKILSENNYDDFYRQPSDPQVFPLNEIKKKMRIRMRNNGILSYQLVLHRSPRVSLEEGADYSQDALWVSQIEPFITSKPLRERGIKVLFSGFTDLTPVSEDVLKKRLESWRAPWVQEARIQQSQRDVQALLTRSHAYAQAQQELVNKLEQVLQGNQLMEEALATRVLQALEAASLDSRTRQLLPANTLEVMRSLRDWIG